MTSADPAAPHSINERAEAVMGRRLSPEQEKIGVVPFDLPCELGYWCPIHREDWDQDLAWSEYHGFLWCARCNRDYPSALCVPLDDREKRAEWVNAGVGDAIKVYLDTVSTAVARALLKIDGGGS